MNDVGSLVNQLRFNRTKAEDDTHKITFKNKSLTTAVYNALKFVAECGGAYRVTDSHVEQDDDWYVVRVYYRLDERIEDYNGEPCWLSDL